MAHIKAWGQLYNWLAIVTKYMTKSYEIDGVINNGDDDEAWAQKLCDNLYNYNDCSDTALKSGVQRPRVDNVSISSLFLSYRCATYTREASTSMWSRVGANYQNKAFWWLWSKWMTNENQRGF